MVRWAGFLLLLWWLSLIAVTYSFVRPLPSLPTLRWQGTKCLALKELTHTMRRRFLHASQSGLRATLNYNEPEPPPSKASTFIGNWPFATPAEIATAKEMGQGDEHFIVNERRPVTPSEFYEVDEFADDFETPPYGDMSRVAFNPTTEQFSYIDGREGTREMMTRLAADLVDEEGEPDEQDKEREAKKPFLVKYTLSELKTMWEEMRQRQETDKKTTQTKTKQKPTKKALKNEKNKDKDKIKVDEQAMAREELPRYDLVLETLMRPNMTIQITDEHDLTDTETNTSSHNATAQSSEDVTYVTEQELRRLWMQHAIRNERQRGVNNDDKFTKPIEFDMKRALLAINDEIDEILSPENEESLFSQSPTRDDRDTVATVKDIAGNKVYWEEEDTEIDESEQELFVTEQELRRLWEERSVFDFRMPADAFNETLSLLLVDPVNEDDPDQFDEGRNAYEQELMNDDDESDPIIERYPYMDPESEEYKELRAALDEIHDDIDDFEEDSQSWPLMVRSLSPSIETQFTPDVMRSLPNSKKKIPFLNYEEGRTNFYRQKYGERYAKAYEATGSMRVDDDEIETDFVKELEDRPLYSYLNLPFGPDHEDSETSNALCPLSPNGTAWADPNVPDYVPEMSSFPLDDRLQDFERIVEIPKRMLMKDRLDFGNIPALKESVEFMENLEQTERVDNVLFRANRIVAINDSVSTVVDGITQVFIPDWSRVSTFDVSCVKVTEFVDDCWARFEQEDATGDEDHFDYSDIFHTLQTVNATLYATSHILLDYEEFDTRHDDVRALKRYATAKMLNQSVQFPVKEPIPDELMPDQDRGITYTNEIIEMKNYKMLLPAENPEEFDDDIFTPNENVRPVNMVGTVRHQYDWEPDLSLMPYEIEREKLERIAPLIRFINYGARLKSTKNNVLVFEYLAGRTRHIIGIRSTLLQLARRHCPEIKDVRLETEEMFDSADVDY